MPASQPMTDSPKLRVFVDSDVLFAGAASPNAHSAALVILQMAEITLVEALTSEQVIVEVEKNLSAKLPGALATFRLLVERCVDVIPAPTRADLIPYEGLAEAKDLPILVAALQTQCPWLATFNIRHYRPGHPAVRVATPGEFVLQARDSLSRLG